MDESINDTHRVMNKWLYQFAEYIIEGKPVSNKVLELILGLTGFDRGGRVKYFAITYIIIIAKSDTYNVASALPPSGPTYQSN